jgi:hypothetical protein
MLLKLTTIFLLFLVWTPAAHAWSWPVQGPVLQPFAYDEAHPYASGQHRGIDIGADAAGDTVAAPAAGTVGFAGTVPTSGKSLTIETADGYSVTLTHLGSIIVAKGAAVAEGDTVGTIGPSGTPEVEGPYVHLGIRVSADPNGYVDPLGLLPVAPPAAPTSDDSTASQPTASGGATGAPAAGSTPVAAAPSPSATTLQGSAVPESRPGVSSRHAQGRAHESRVEVRRPRSSQQPAAHGEDTRARAPRQMVTPQRHRKESTSSSRRPVVEAAAPTESTGLDAGHEPQPSVSAVQPPPPPRQPSNVLLPLVCNGAAALVALAAALAAARRRRRPVAGGQVLHLPPLPGQRHERRAA